MAESFSGLGRLPPSLSINMDRLRQPRGRARSQAGQVGTQQTRVLSERTQRARLPCAMAQWG